MNRRGVRLALWVIPLLLVCYACVPATPAPTSTATAVPSATATFPFPTLIPTATELPPSTLAPPPEPDAGLGTELYKTGFENAADWPLGRDSLGATSLLDGQLSIVVTNPHTTRIVSSPAPAARDFVLQASFTAQLCAGQDEYGLVFRRNDDGEHLRFTITCEGGVRARRVSAAGPRALVPFVERHPAVMAGAPARNRLAVRAFGSQVLLYVNGAQVLAITDAQAIAGTSGAVVTADDDGQATLLLDEYTLHELAPTPTAASTTEAPDG